MGESRIGASSGIRPARTPDSDGARAAGSNASSSATAPSSSPLPNAFLDAFDDDGRPSLPRVAAGGMAVLGAGTPELASEMRRRILEAHVGHDSYARGPSAGVSRTLKDGKSERSLFSKTRERGSASVPEADSGAPESGRFKDWSASSTVFAAGRIADATFVEKRGEAELAGGVKASGDVHAGRAWGIASVDAGVDLKTGDVTGNAGLRGELHAVGAEGSLTKELGSDDNQVGMMAWGKAYVGAEAGGNVGVRLSAKERTAKVSAGVDAFAGAKAVAVLRPSVKIAGEDITGLSGVTAEAYAGIGVKANAEAGIEKGRLKAKLELGAALGIGGGVGVTVDVNVVGIAKVTKKGLEKGAEAARDAGQAVVAGARETRAAVSENLDAVGDTVRGAFRSVSSWW